MPEDDRLVRLEGKVDRIGEALVQLARLDERIAMVLEQNRAMQIAMDECHDRLDALEQLNFTRDPLFRWTERLVLAAFGAAMAWAFAKVRP